MERFDTAVLRYLADAVWQPLLILLAAALADRIVRRAGPHYRYLLWVNALLLCVLTPALSVKAPTVLKGAAVMQFQVSGQLASASAPVRRAAGLLTIFYALYVLYLWLRMGLNLCRLRQLRATAEPVATDVSVSDMVTTPVTFGVRNPVIILPRQFAQAAAPETIKAVIAHERGHWQRHDYAWNLALQFLTAPIRFHPAVSGAMRQMAAMRELAADELAAASTPHYAERLVDAARLLRQTPEPSAIGLGLFDCDRLEERIMKLTNPKPALSTWTARILTTAMTMVLTVGAIAISNYTAFAQAPDKVGPNVTAPKLIYKVEPTYEDSARTDKVSGSVLLSLVVTKEGIADQITVKRSLDPRLDERAIIAVKQWRFKPGQKNGEDTSVLAMIEVNFRLE